MQETLWEAECLVSAVIIEEKVPFPPLWINWVDLGPGSVCAGFVQLRMCQPLLQALWIVPIRKNIHNFHQKAVLAGGTEPLGLAALELRPNKRANGNLLSREHQ